MVLTHLTKLNRKPAPQGPQELWKNGRFQDQNAFSVAFLHFKLFLYFSLIFLAKPWQSQVHPGTTGTDFWCGGQGQGASHDFLGLDCWICLDVFNDFFGFFFDFFWMCCVFFFDSWSSKNMVSGKFWRPPWPAPKRKRSRHLSPLMTYQSLAFQGSF